jgi:lysophospholipase L1-like esterase
MQIRMLASRFAAGGALSYVAGSTYEVADDMALQFIGDNAAVEVGGSRAVATGTQRDEFNRGAEGRAAVSLVSGAGIASTRALTCCLLGDSFSNRNYSSPSEYYRWMDWGYFVWANALLGSPFKLLKNGGIAGENSAQALARLQSDVLDYRPDWCFLLSSVNDTGDGLVAADTIANNVQMIDRMVAAGITVVVLAICPYTTNAAATKNIHQVNRYLSEYARTKKGVIFVDTYSALINPTSATGALASGMSDDALHPSAKGARKMGAAIAQVLSPILKGYAVVLPSSMSETYSVDTSEYQMLQNPLFTGTGGTASTASIPGAVCTGTVADGWTAGPALLASSVDCSLAARSDGIGNDQVLTISSAVSGALVNIRLTASLSGLASAGDTVYFCGEMTLSSPVDVVQCRAYIAMTVGGVQYNITVFDPSLSTYDNTAFTVKFRTADFVIPAGAVTQMQGRLDVKFGTSGSGSAVLKLGRAGLYRIPA